MNVYADVRAFHEQCNVPVLTSPAVPDEARQRLRFSLINEEITEELLPALRRGDLVEIADGIADAIYVLAGTALEYGIPLDKVWAAVQASNMQKRAGNERGDGKILKPEGWKHPDIAAILAAEMVGPMPAAGDL